MKRVPSLTPARSAWSLPPHAAARLGLGARGHRLAEYADGRKDAVNMRGPLVVELEGRDTREEALVLGDEVLIGQTVPEKLDPTPEGSGTRPDGKSAHRHRAGTKREPGDREVMIERECVLDAVSPHDDEAGAVDEAERMLRVPVEQADGLRFHIGLDEVTLQPRALVQDVQKPSRDPIALPDSQERVRVCDHVIRGDQRAESSQVLGESFAEARWRSWAVDTSARRTLPARPIRSSKGSRARGDRPRRTRSTPSRTSFALELRRVLAMASSFRSCASVKRIWTRVMGPPRLARCV